MWWTHFLDQTLFDSALCLHIGKYYLGIVFMLGLYLMMALSSAGFVEIFRSVSDNDDDGAERDAADNDAFPSISDAMSDESIVGPADFLRTILRTRAAPTGMKISQRMTPPTVTTLLKVTTPPKVTRAPMLLM